MKVFAQINLHNSYIIIYKEFFLHKLMCMIQI
jgi:hypothetical protein